MNTLTVISAVLLLCCLCLAAAVWAWLRAVRERHALQLSCAAAEQRCTALQEQQAQQRAALAAQQERELAHARELHAETVAHLQQKLAEQQQQHEHDRREQERRWEESRKSLAEQFRVLAAETLRERARELNHTNGEQMDALMKPLRLQLEDLGKAVTATRTQGAEHKAALESTIREMMTQTRQIGKDAVNLTNALKGNSKIQGDWGEMILEKMLEDSGLKAGEHYVIQESVRDADGNLFRPDVVVRFPRERSVIIDSKVSLTAYAAYAAAEDEEERRSLLAAHVLSVRKHIEELAAKDYGRLVKESIGYVLMFLPNEAAYTAALQGNAALPLYAYERKVLLVSPTNLLMALQLADSLWQNEAQVQNVEKIYDRATQLYEKFQGFQADFMSVGKALKNALSTYEAADGKLCTGKGNFVRQVEMLREMGVSPNPKKQLVLKDE